MNLLLHFILLAFSIAAAAASFDYPTVKPGTRWVNTPAALNNSVDFFDGSKVRALLLRGTLGPRFACGFYSTPSSSPNFLFGVFIVITDSASGIVMPALGFPQPVWAANPRRHVTDGATLDFLIDGNLVLRDHLGAIVWQSATAAAGVDAMSLDPSGSLSLLASSRVVWQSFQHPTDVLLPRQILKPGTRLSSVNGEFYLAMEDQGLTLYADSDSPSQPQAYWSRTVSPASAGSSAFARYDNGSLGIYVTVQSQSGAPDASVRLQRTPSAQYLRLSHDGRLLLVAWGDDDRGWRVEEDVLGQDRSFSRCSLPRACGRFGVCTDEGECSCPASFRAADVLRPSRGCVPPKPYRCSRRGVASGFLELKGMDYFANDFSSGIWGKSLQQCRELCAGDCSCRAAFYRNGAKVSKPEEGGICYVVSEVLTLRNSYRGPGYNSVAYIKV